jgi:DNA-binding beta-propeller fold protein YncE
MPVLDWGGGTVTPIDTATDTAQRPIQVGSFPSAIAISPHGGTADVANYGTTDEVTPIATATRRPGRAVPVTVGNFPVAVAISPEPGAARRPLPHSEEASLTVRDACQLPHRQVPAATKAPRNP